MRKLAEVLPDPSDRGLSPLPSTPSPRAKVDWKPWARPLEFLARVAPPEGLTVEQTGERVAAYAQALAARYSGFPAAMAALSAITAEGMTSTWEKFPSLPALIGKIDAERARPLTLAGPTLERLARMGKRLPWFRLRALGWDTTSDPTPAEFATWLGEQGKPLPWWLMQASPRNT